MIHNKIMVQLERVMSGHDSTCIRIRIKSRERERKRKRKK